MNTPAPVTARTATRQRLVLAGTLFFGLACVAHIGLAQAVTNATALTPPELPSAGPSMLRVFGALALVIGLFIGGAWAFRNGAHLRFNRGPPPKLRVLESRSLGGRHAVFVVAYEREKLLLSSSPSGINLLTHLAASAEPEEPAEPTSSAIETSFAQTLAKKVLSCGKTSLDGGRK